VGSPDWFRCGRQAGEFTMLNLPQEETHPSFGNSIQDLFEENLAVNEMNTLSEPLYTTEEKELVQFGINCALGCVTHSSPHFRSDLFRYTLVLIDYGLPNHSF
jgi:hypothetical protein